MKTWIPLLALLSIAACDLPPEAVLDAVRSPEATEAEPCNAELLEVASARAEAFSCHAECGELLVECLQLEAPSCHACEHEAAICRSTCPDPALWAAVEL